MSSLNYMNLRDFENISFFSGNSLFFFVPHYTRQVLPKMDAKRNDHVFSKLNGPSWFLQIFVLGTVQKWYQTDFGLPRVPPPIQKSGKIRNWSKKWDWTPLPHLKHFFKENPPNSRKNYLQANTQISSFNIFRIHYVTI